MDNDELDLLTEIKAAMNKAIDERAPGISSVVVLVNGSGCRAELQSSSIPMDSLLTKAHNSIGKLNGGGSKGSPGYTE